MQVSLGIPNRLIPKESEANFSIRLLTHLIGMRGGGTDIPKYMLWL